MQTLRNPQKEAFKFLLDGENEEVSISYEILDLKARMIAAYLQRRELAGKTVLLVYPPGVNYITAFFGCMYAGVLAVPVYPPKRNRSNISLQTIIASSKAEIALTDRKTLDRIINLFTKNNFLSNLDYVSTDTIDAGYVSNWYYPDINQDSLAYLQFTSGSTAFPKGVMLSHANLLSNLETIHRNFNHSVNSKGVIWLPPYHDMGLIGGILEPIYSGFSVVLMSPIAFLQKPVRWLNAISKYKATTSGGPNFAYDLCIKKIDADEKSNLDLSTWNIAFNGSEKIQSETINRFVRTFGDCGFKRKSFFPCYGLAEASLYVSGSNIVTKEPSDFEEKALEDNKYEINGVTEKMVHNVSSCGKLDPEQKVAIVDPKFMTRCKDGEVGEVWISGSSVAQGYWQLVEETERTFKARIKNEGETTFLRSGDMGFVNDNELFIVGRIKDTILIRGKNYYPQDIEQIVKQTHVALLERGCAAFGMEIEHEERLVVIHEVKREYIKKIDDLADDIVGAIRQVISENFNLDVFSIVLVKPGGISRTTSNKIQRFACRAKYSEGTIKAIYEWNSTKRLEQNRNYIRKTENYKSNEEFDGRQWKIKEFLVDKISQRQRIKHTNIDRNKSFSWYGIDSVESIELVTELEDMLKISLSPSIVWEYPSINLLSNYLLENVLSNSDYALKTTDDTQTLIKDAELCSTVQPKKHYEDLDLDRANVFLTGATGFLGIHLLYEILSTTEAKVYCLVREANITLATNKIIDLLKKHYLWNLQFIDRIIPVIGELDRPNLGLSAEKYQDLSQKIDTIYHSGALLNFVYPYSFKLREINALGTEEILKLACANKTKIVNYISSVSVFEAADKSQKTISETDLLNDVNSLQLGYSKSKWVGEKLVLSAKERGLPIYIYRSPFISGHTRTGVWNTNDFVCRFIKGCLQLGASPDINFLLNIAPVDYISKAIVHISSRKDLIGKTFHLMNPNPIKWNDFCDIIREHSFSIDTIPFCKWKEQLKYNTRTSSNALYPLLPLFSSSYIENSSIFKSYQEESFNVSQEFTDRILQEVSITCPKISKDLVERYFTYFKGIKFLDCSMVLEDVLKV